MQSHKWVLCVSNQAHVYVVVYDQLWVYGRGYIMFVWSGLLEWTPHVGLPGGLTTKITNFEEETNYGYQKATPKQYPFDYQLNPPDVYDDAKPMPSVQGRSDIRKRIREDLQEQIANAYQKKTKFTNKDENTYPKFLLIESRNTEGDTLTKLSPFAVSKYIEHIIGIVASVKRL